RFGLERLLNRIELAVISIAEIAETDGLSTEGAKLGEGFGEIADAFESPPRRRCDRLAHPAGERVGLLSRGLSRATDLFVLVDRRRGRRADLFEWFVEPIGRRRANPVIAVEQ